MTQEIIIGAVLTGLAGIATFLGFIGKIIYSNYKLLNSTLDIVEKAVSHMQIALNDHCAGDKDSFNKVHSDREESDHMITKQLEKTIERLENHYANPVIDARFALQEQKIDTLKEAIARSENNTGLKIEHACSQIIGHMDKQGKR